MRNYVARCVKDRGLPYLDCIYGPRIAAKKSEELGKNYLVSIVLLNGSWVYDLSTEIVNNVDLYKPLNGEDKSLRRIEEAINTICYLWKVPYRHWCTNPIFVTNHLKEMERIVLDPSHYPIEVVRMAILELLIPVPNLSLYYRSGLESPMVLNTNPEIFRLEEQVIFVIDCIRQFQKVVSELPNFADINKKYEEIISQIAVR